MVRVLFKRSLNGRFTLPLMMGVDEENDWEEVEIEGLSPTENRLVVGIVGVVAVFKVGVGIVVSVGGNVVVSVGGSVVGSVGGSVDIVGERVVGGVGGFSNKCIEPSISEVLDAVDTKGVVDSRVDGSTLAVSTVGIVED